MGSLGKGWGIRDIQLLRPLVDCLVFLRSVFSYHRENACSEISLWSKSAAQEAFTHEGRPVSYNQ